MNIEQLKNIAKYAPDGEQYFSMDNIIHNLDDTRTIIDQHEEIERLRGLLEATICSCCDKSGL